MEKPGEVKEGGGTRREELEGKRGGSVNEVDFFSLSAYLLGSAHHAIHDSSGKHPSNPINRERRNAVSVGHRVSGLGIFGGDGVENGRGCDCWLVSHGELFLSLLFGLGIVVSLVVATSDLFLLSSKGRLLSTRGKDRALNVARLHDGDGNPKGIQLSAKAIGKPLHSELGRGVHTACRSS
jgi:hypothetical protein